jgi:hypothetical protein
MARLDRAIALTTIVHRQMARSRRAMTNVAENVCQS